MSRISRPCYDKYRRCPGWAGPGLKYNKDGEDWCENGIVDYTHFEKRLWKWRVAHCPICHTTILPYHVRWVDPTWLWSSLKWKWYERYRAKEWLWRHIGCPILGHKWKQKMYVRLCDRCIETEATE